MRPFLLLLLAGLLPLIAVEAVTPDGGLCVAASHPQAADTNPGTSELPFKTITAAVAKAGAGGTVLIKAGLYRETVVIRKGGEKDRPLIIRAAPGERVIVTGAEPVVGWRKCSQEDALGNADFAKLYLADLAAQPDKLIESSAKRMVYKLSRLPAEGQWQPDGAVGRRSFTDAAHLTAADANAFAGWTLLTYYNAGGGATVQPSFTYDPQKHQITLGKDWSNYADIDPQRDTYWFENHPAGISGPGQFAYRKTEQGWRCWVWPTAMVGDQPAVERLARGECLNPNRAAFLVIDGLELCFAKGQAIGHNATLADSTIQNCYIHDCIGYAIGLTKPERVTVRRSVFRENSHGVVMQGGVDCVVEENDIGWCLVDGLCAANGVRNLRIRRNFIHDNFRYGHPDNLQFWSDVDGVWIEDNVLLNGGQMVMSEGMKNVHVVNNLMLGSHAAGLILGGESGRAVYGIAQLKPDERSKRIAAFEICPPDGIEVVHNTICATGLSPTNWGGTGFSIRDNVIAPLHPSPLYQLNSLRSAVADHNLLWAGGKGGVNVHSLIRSGEGDQASMDVKILRDLGLPVLQEKFGLEKHGVAAEPQFRNAAKFYAVSHYGSITASTRGKLVLWGQVGGSIAVGDRVEIAFDGVARTITEVGIAPGKNAYSTITFAPPLDRLSDFPVSVANWGDTTDLTWDLQLADASPGRGKASDGKDMGCSINLRNYRLGDFDGDGKRDLPELPKE